MALLQRKAFPKWQELDDNILLAKNRQHQNEVVRGLKRA
jgi:hypothetical protein